MTIENYLDETKVRETAEVFRYISDTCGKVSCSNCHWSELAITFLSKYEHAQSMQKTTPELRDWFVAALQILRCHPSRNDEEIHRRAKRIINYEDQIWDAALSEVDELCES